ncbi:putative serine/threonine-protein kinase [Gossypium australe]|uniref:Putative serine/threonine-protein kinase n=1 Tax=Gossypium australe TaxID=47621 RepID=A0A5B6WTU4_9ROSI|nr:putative serine/threonine-protein kinase [Gossypium australe]
MATALANRAAQNQTTGLLRLSFNFFRNLSTATSTEKPGASSSASKKPKRKKKKNLFEVAQFLPNWGLGYHMAKTHWTDVSYQITKINLYKDGRHGKAWGVSLLTSDPWLEKH